MSRELGMGAEPCLWRSLAAFVTTSVLYAEISVSNAELSAFEMTDPTSPEAPRAAPSHLPYR